MNRTFAYGSTVQRIFYQIGKEIHIMEVDPYSRDNLKFRLGRMV